MVWNEALRLARGARRVEDEQRVFRVHPLGLVAGGLGVDDVVPPHVLGPLPRRVLARALDHEHVRDRAPDRPGCCSLGARASSTSGLRAKVCAAAVAAVGGDDELGLGVVDALAQALGAEAAEDHGVDGADARAGEHRDHGFGDLREVDRDAVALADAQREQAVCGLLHALVHVVVGERLGVAGLALEVERDALAAALAHVAVYRVVARVEGAVGEPSGDRGVGPIEHLRERRVPREALRLLAPIAEAIGARAVVLVRGRVRVRGESSRAAGRCASR